MTTSRTGATAYFEAYASDEHATFAPRYAAVEVTPGFLATLSKLWTICTSNGLTEVRSASSPTWGPPGVEDEVHLVSPVLVVTAWSFWFEEESKHSNFSFKTRLQPIHEFMQRVLINDKAAPLLFGPAEMLQQEADIDDELADGPDGWEPSAVAQEGRVPPTDGGPMDEPWREAGASDEELAILARAGGYATIVESAQAKLQHQDILDHCLTSRLIAVREALRNSGWEGPPYGALSKDVEGVRFAFDHHVEKAGPGANVVALSYTVFDVSTPTPNGHRTRLLHVADRMAQRSTDLAVQFEDALAQVLQSRGTCMPASQTASVGNDGLLQP